MRALAEQLSRLAFSTTSDCGMVTVVQDGSGALTDITFDDRALRSYDARQMAQVVAQTIQDGESVIRDALREANQRAGEEAA